MIRLELRCRSRQACLLATVHQSPDGRLVADVRVRSAVMKGPDSQEWSTDRYTVEIGDDYLLLGCRHVQGLTEHPDAIRSYVQDTPIGVRLLG